MLYYDDDPEDFLCKFFSLPNNKAKIGFCRMPYYFHKDRELYFKHQTMTTNNYIVPFIEEYVKIEAGMNVLEIGCAEAGVLKAFTDRGCIATGVDFSEGKLKVARRLMKNELMKKQISFFNKDIYEEDFKNIFHYQFDLIILKDVIEHIHDQENLIGYLNTFLKTGGTIFFSFPPWFMPFGGHQQMCKSKILAKMPYFHLLPLAIYKWILKSFGEIDNKIKGLTEIKKTGISIERFEKIININNYKVISKKHFLFNPIYEYKFNIKPRVQYRLIQRLPYFRDLFTTAVYYLVKP